MIPDAILTLITVSKHHVALAEALFQPLIVCPCIPNISLAHLGTFCPLAIAMFQQDPNDMIEQRLPFAPGSNESISKAQVQRLLQ